jgi:hypothetical protein
VSAHRINLVRLRANLYAKGMGPDPRCEMCGRLVALKDWHPVQPCCRDCADDRAQASDDMLGEGPFLPEDSDA